MINRINYSIFFVFALFMIILPRFVRRGLFAGLARLVYWIDAKHRDIIDVNLTIAFGEDFPQKRRKEIAQGCFRNLFFELQSVLESYFFSTKTMVRGLDDVKGVEHVEKAHREGKPIVFFTAHYNDLEIAAIAISQVTHTVQSAQKASNPYINAFISKGREQSGITIVSIERAIRAQTRQLKAGGDISVVVDQAVLGADVEFFGLKAKHTISTARMVREYDAVLMPAFLLGSDRSDWEPTIFPPIPFTKTDDEAADLQYLVQAQASFTENLIRKNPDPWFWCHRRWKDHYPNIYQKKSS